jgi:hypothetical protein
LEFVEYFPYMKTVVFSSKDYQIQTVFFIETFKRSEIACTWLEFLGHFRLWKEQFLYKKITFSKISLCETFKQNETE